MNVHFITFWCCFRDSSTFFGAIYVFFNNPTGNFLCPFSYWIWECSTFAMLNSHQQVINHVLSVTCSLSNSDCCYVLSSRSACLAICSRNGAHIETVTMCTRFDPLARRVHFTSLGVRVRSESMIYYVIIMLWSYITDLINGLPLPWDAIQVRYFFVCHNVGYVLLIGCKLHRSL